MNESAEGVLVALGGMRVRRVRDGCRRGSVTVTVTVANLSTLLTIPYSLSFSVSRKFRILSCKAREACEPEGLASRPLPRNSGCCSGCSVRFWFGLV